MEDTIPRRRLLEVTGVSSVVLAAGCLEPSDGSESPEEESEEKSFTINLEDIRFENCGPTCEEVQIITTIINKLDTDVESVSLDLEIHVTTGVLERELDIYREWKDIEVLEAGESQQVEFSFEAGVNDAIDAYRGDCDFVYEVEVEYVETGGIHSAGTETHRGVHEMECNFQ